jgi:hypothetical protein
VGQPSERDQRVNEAIAAYLEAVDQVCFLKHGCSSVGWGLGRKGLPLTCSAALLGSRSGIRTGPGQFSEAQGPLDTVGRDVPRTEPQTRQPTGWERSSPVRIFSSPRGRRRCYHRGYAE